MPSILTSSGLFMPHDCDENNLRIFDIADALSKKPRFSGQGRGFISVAEHCYHMSRCMLQDTGDRDLAASALMHDAVEAYWADIPSPYKSQIQAFIDMEEEWLKKIMHRYQLPYPIPVEVHEYDQRVRINEVQKLFPNQDPCIFGAKNGSAPLMKTTWFGERFLRIRGWNWRRSRRKFLKMAKQLGISD